jgi:hypothetical protein
MATEEPARLPLRAHFSHYHDGVSSDGAVALFPDDPDYEREYRVAVRTLERHGTPIPYASQTLIDQTRAQRAEAVAS